MSAMPRRADLLRESILIAVTGIAFGLLANGLSPRGISLRRDYFSMPVTVRTAAVPAPVPGAPSLTMDGARRSKLVQLGVTMISHARAVEEFHDPGVAEGRIVFIDARDDARYQAGHIPSAFPFDHYRMENYLANVLTACTVAERAIIYCTGGECEDSELAATDLVQFGIPANKLFLYEGGVTEWDLHGQPLESGSRNSGKRVKR